MKIKSGYMLREIAGGYFVVPSGGDNNRMITLNEPARDMWQVLEKGADETELFEAMKELYDADEETLDQDIKEFLSKLSDAGLLEN